MKKTIEAELNKLAEKILEDGSEKSIDQLKDEAKALYEKLTILKFTYANLEDAQPKTKAVSYAEDTFAPSKPQLSRTQTQTTYKEGNYFVPDGTEFNENDAITEPATEKIKDIVAQMPPETEGLDRLMEALNEDWTQIKPELEQAPQNTIEQSSQSEKAESEELNEPENPTESKPEVTEDLFTNTDIPEEHFAEIPSFEPMQPDPEPEPEEPEEESKPIENKEETKADSDSETDFRQIGVDYDNLPDFEPLNNRQGERPRSVNDRLKSGISIGLNDRLAYIKHLFAGNSSDYNRVLSQLNTFSDFDEAYKFIQLVVKPDYNNWEGKEQYEDRFVQIIANKFQ